MKSYYYFISRHSQVLTLILGIRKVSLDDLINSSSEKYEVYRMWKVSKELERFLESKEAEKQEEYWKWVEKNV